MHSVPLRIHTAGGGSGIGQAIALELLQLGCNVLISSRSLQRLEAAADELSAAAGPDGGKVDIFPCDIRDEDRVRAMFAHGGKIELSAGAPPP